jgi:N-acetylmuramoyl-L-alanine amidase
MRLSRVGLGIVSAAAVSCASFTPAFAATSNTVTVKPGDTMWLIAKAHGIKVQALENSNPTVDPYDMLVGTVLKLPEGSANTKSTTATSENLYWMEHVIHAEAGGESLQAQIAVGDVILHRMNHGGYGRTVKDVVFQVQNGHYQFTTVANGYIYSTPNESSKQAAKAVLENHTDVVPGAMVFYNPGETPANSWVWSQPTITRIGKLVFAK